MAHGDRNRRPGFNIFDLCSFVNSFVTFVFKLDSTDYHLLSVFQEPLVYEVIWIFAEK